MRLIRPNRPSRWSSKFSTFRNRSKCAACHQRANQSSRACSQQRQEKFLAASEDQPATTHGSGSSSRLRNSTGLPSAYNPIAPELTDDPVTSFCSTPVTRTVTVLLVAGRPAQALALVHAGWRGMVAGIVGEAARVLGASGAA